MTTPCARIADASTRTQAQSRPGYLRPRSGRTLRWRTSRTARTRRAPSSSSTSAISSVPPSSPRCRLSRHGTTAADRRVAVRSDVQHVDLSFSSHSCALLPCCVLRAFTRRWVVVLVRIIEPGVMGLTLHARACFVALRKWSGGVREAFNYSTPMYGLHRWEEDAMPWHDLRWRF